MITVSDVNKMCALLEPHDVGVALAKRLRELCRDKLAILEAKLKAEKEKQRGEITDKRLEYVLQLGKQWHAANELYMWVTDLLEQKEAFNE